MVLKVFRGQRYTFFFVGGALYSNIKLQSQTNKEKHSHLHIFLMWCTTASKNIINGLVYQWHLFVLKQLTQKENPTQTFHKSPKKEL